MRKLLLLFAMCSSIGSWAQTVTPTVNGKTLTLTCEGDVSNLQATVVTGYTFNQAAVNAPVYKGNNESAGVVTNGEAFNGTYYAKSYTYSQANITTVDGYVLNQDVYQFDGTATYSLKASGTGLAAGGSGFYSRTNAGTEVLDMSSYLGAEAFTSLVSSGDGIYKFDSSLDVSSQGYLATKVLTGDTYEDGYVYTIGQYNNPPIINKESLLSGGYLGQAVSDAATSLYALVDGNYTKAAGTVYNASATYFDGVAFTSIDDVYTSPYTENTTTVSTGSDTYYTLNGDEYIEVVDGSVFTGNQLDYYKKDATPTFQDITSELQSLGYIEPVYGTDNFWTGISKEIKANGYENIIVTGGTISSDNIKEILYDKTANSANTSIKTLDLGGTTCKDLDKGSFALTGATYVVADMNLTTLTLPHVPVVEEKEIVPSEVLDGLALNTNTKLTNIIIPEGYTHIGNSAFTTLDNITDVTLPSTLVEIGDNAFRANKRLVHINQTATRSITFPDGLQVIGEYAFFNCCVDEQEIGIASTPDDPLELKVPIIKAAAFASNHRIRYIIFREGVKFIGNSAFALSGSVDHTQTAMTFPNTVEYIGPNCFNFRYYDDIYFKSTTAPACPIGKSVLGGDLQVNAFYEQIHMGNDGFVPMGATGGAEVTGTADQISLGYANRENYINGDKYFTILHFPSDLTEAQAETFTDITRVYKTYRHDDGTFNQNDWDYPGKGTTAFSTDLAITYTMPDAVKVNIGYEDTYAGAQKIWPSQMQWMRSYACNFNGYKWDGVTEYRPEVTPRMIDWMLLDNLTIKVDGSLVTLTEESEITEAAANTYNSQLPGAVHVGDPISYYENQNEVDEANMLIDGAITAGTVYYSEKEINEHNEKLPTAVHVGDIEIPAVPEQQATYWQSSEVVTATDGKSYDITTVTYYPEQQETYYGDDELEYIGDKQYIKTTLTFHEQAAYTKEELLELLGGPSQEWRLASLSQDGEGNYLYSYYTVNDESVVYTGQYKTPYIAAYYVADENSIEATAGDIKTPYQAAQPAVPYTQETANAHNRDIQGAWNETTVKGTYTEQEAVAYNNALPNAVKIGSVKEAWTEDDANIENAKLEDAITAGAQGANYIAYYDQLSKDAYQGTRRFVLADGDTKPTPEYPLDIKGEKWWTICVPFNMTKAMVDETFGVGTHVCLFSKVDRDADSANKKITLYFQNDVYVHKSERASETAWTSSATVAPGDNDVVIWAHEAYMIRPSKKSDDPADYAVHLYRPLSGSPKPTIVTANDGTEYRFVGNYEKSLAVEDATGNTSYSTKKIPQYSYMYAKKTNDSNYKFWFNTSKNISWSPNKCVVQATAKDGGFTDSKDFFGLNQANGVKQISIFGDFYDEYNSEEDEATGIQNITIIAGDGEDSEVVYNLNGQMVNPNAASKGVYFKGGKKVFVK